MNKHFNRKNIYKEYKKSFWNSLIISFILSIVFYVLSLNFLTDEIKISIGFFILSFLAIILASIIYELLKTQDSITTELTLISQSAKILELIKKDEPEIIHFEQFLFKSLFDKIPDEGGGYVLYNVTSIKYKDILKTAIDVAKSSYNITLTGKYKPAYFFYDDDVAGTNVIFSKEEKQAYLTDVNTLPKRIVVTRILIFDKKDLQISDKKNKIDFYINFHKNIRLFWITPKDLKCICEKDAIETTVKNDYGVVDDSLIINKIENADKCEVLFSNNNYKFNKIFKLLVIDQKKDNEYRKFKNYNEIKESVGLTEYVEKH